MKVCFDTFGCRLNRAEALQMEADFLARGWQTTDEHADADLIIVRGCSVTARAQRDCERLIDHLRRKYPNKRVVTTGCLTEKRNEHWLRDLGHATSGVPTRTARAYLKVQDGCSCNCSFCVVPQFRGPSVSLDFEQVLEKARAFHAAGYNEIVVTGCNLSSYQSNGRHLADLARALADLDPVRRVRLSSIEPGPAAQSLVEVMAEKPNICRFLHLTIQSGSNAILTAMRRPYSSKIVQEIIQEATKRMPRLAIGCDLMVGFPGETDLDFLATKMLFRRFTIAKAHIFPYSERPGTAAALFRNALSSDVRHDRAHELAELADAERTKFAKSFIGQTVEIVVEDEEHLAGWTSEYLWCSVPHAASERSPFTRRQIMRIKVHQAEGHALVGVPV